MRGSSLIAALLAAAVLIGASGELGGAERRARRRVHRLRLRRVHGAVDRRAQRLARLAVPRARHLHRRRQPRVRGRQPVRDLGLFDARRRLEPAAALRRPAGAVRRTERAAEDLDRLRDRRQPGAGGRRRRDRARRTTFGLPVGQPDLLRHGGLLASTTQPARRPCKSFVAAWTIALHAQGYLSGVYGSAASTMRDVASLGRRPARRRLDRELERRRERLRRSVRERQRLGEPPARAPVQGRPQGDLGRRDDQHRLERRRRPGRRRLGRAAAAAAAVEPPAGSVGSGDSKATATWPQAGVRVDRPSSR